MSKKYLVLLAVLVLVVVGGYAVWQGTLTDEERVGNRAIERWNAIMAGDHKKAYSYLGPGYRSATPYAVYEAKLKGAWVKWKKVELKTIKCEPELCTVELHVDYHPTMKQFEAYQLQKNLIEKWVKVNNQWWHAP